MSLIFSQHIAAPPECVFEFLDDAEKLKAWMDGLEETVYPDGLDRARAAGTKFKQRIREGGRLSEYDGEITAYDRPRHLGVRIGNRMFQVQVDFRLSPEGAGTRLDYAVDVSQSHWFARLMGFLFGWLTRRILYRQMAKLKAVAEGAART